jgi:hypothetical protein
MANKNDEIKAKLSRFSEIEKPKKSIKTSTGGIDLSALDKELRSASGLNQKKAGALFYGSESNYSMLDPNGRQTRNRIREAWRNIDKSKEISVAHTKSDQKQTYFIIAKSEYRDWVENFGAFGVKIDSESEYNAKELGLE